MKDLSGTLELSQVSTRLLSVVRRLSEEIRGGEVSAACGLDSSFVRDLGIDSLGRLELSQRIEKQFGVTLPEQLIMTAETPRGLVDALARAGASGLSEAVVVAQPDIVSLVEEEAKPPRDARTLLDALEWHVSMQPQRVHAFLIDENDRPEALSYARLRADASVIGGSLLAKGLRRGERVSMMLPTGRDFLASFYGILWAGGVPVPLYPPVSYAKIEEHVRRQASILSSSGSRFMISVPEGRKLGAILRGLAPCLEEVFSCAELYHYSPAPHPVSGLSPDDIAFIQYTSGSTGAPKGVTLSHHNLLSNIRVISERLAVSSRDVCVSWLPLYHDMGLIGAWLGSLYNGCPLVLMSPLHFLAKPSRWLRAIESYGGTISAAPNFAYELCAQRVDREQIEGLDLSSWRIAMSGAEAVSPKTVAGFAERYASYGFRKEALMPVYGLAESSLAVTIPTPGRGVLVDRVSRESLQKYGRAIPVAPDAPAIEFVSCGSALDGHEVRVVDKSGYEAPDREQGLVQFRGPSATGGYFGIDSASLFSGTWINSGDYGYMVKGELFVTGRQKDLIIRAGRNIYPHELEEAISKVDGVRSGAVAVFAVRDERQGSEKMVVVAEARDTASSEDLKARISRITGDLCGLPPDEVVLVAARSVPKTSSGKIRRSACKQLYEQGDLGRRRSPVLQLARLSMSALPSFVISLGKTVRRALYAVWFWGSGALVVLTSLLAIAACPGRGARRWLARLGSKVLLRCWGLPVEVKGCEKLDEHPGAIVIANHSSYLDAFLLSAVLPSKYVFVAKRELASIPVISRMLRSLGTLFVERTDAVQGIEDMHDIRAAIERGERVIFFPEGTFTRAPGVLPFRLGAFLLAAECGRPILPIVLSGTRNVLRSDQWYPRREELRVKVEDPLAPAGGDWQAAVALKEAARQLVLSETGEPDLSARTIELAPAALA